MESTPLYTENAAFKEVLLYKNKNTLEKQARISLYPDKITVSGKDNEYLFTFDKTSAASVLGKNKLNIYHGDKVYQIEGDKHFCALKYVNLYYRYTNIKKGDENVRFLGL